MRAVWYLDYRCLHVLSGRSHHDQANEITKQLRDAQRDTLITVFTPKPAVFLGAMSKSCRFLKDLPPASNLNAM
jgi:hypothetical protein